MRRFDPGSDLFKKSFTSEYMMVYNPTSYYYGSTPSTFYVQLSDRGLHSDTSKVYIVDFIMNYNHSPIDDPVTREEAGYRFLVPLYVELRINKAVVFNLETTTYSLEDSYEMYPAITFRKWYSSVNNPDIRKTVYDRRIGWGSSPYSLTDIYNKYKAIELGGNGWLFELYKQTYLYIRYGTTIAVPTPFDTNWLNIHDNYLLYVENNVANDYNIVVETKEYSGRIYPTSIRFHENAFSSIVFF